MKYVHIVRRSATYTKLNWKLVKEIRERYQIENLTCAELGKEYGVTRATIQNVVNDRTWKEKVR